VWPFADGKLVKELKDIDHLEGVMGLLGWDERECLPPLGQP
jgi:Zn-dependent M32 family carboxypeptidase